MRVLVPFDGSDLAEKAVAHAIEQYEDAEVVLLHVLDFVEAGYEAVPETDPAEHWTDWEESARDRAEALFEAVEAAFGREFTTEVVHGKPANAIVAYVDEGDVDAVVIGSHGRRGVSRILIGSVAETVVRRSPVPVTVVR